MSQPQRAHCSGDRACHALTAISATHTPFPYSQFWQFLKSEALILSLCVLCPLLPSLHPSLFFTIVRSLFDLSLKVGFIQMKPVADTRHLQTQALSLPLTHPQARFPPPRWGQKQTSHSGCCNIKKICVFLYIINVFFPLFLYLISFFLSIWAEIPSCIASIEQNRIFLFRSWFSSFELMFSLLISTARSWLES